MRQKEKRTEQLTCLSEQFELRVDRKLNDWIADILIIHFSSSSCQSGKFILFSVSLWWFVGVVVLVLLCMCVSVGIRGVVSVVVVGSLLLFDLYPALYTVCLFVYLFVPVCFCLSVFLSVSSRVCDM